MGRLFHRRQPRGIRASQEYVRKGGATARAMLIQAAANEWKIPASECSAANSVITHTPSGRKTTFGKVAEAAAKIATPNKKISRRPSKSPSEPPTRINAPRQSP